MKLDFFDPEVNDCPYHAYAYLRDEALVWGRRDRDVHDHPLRGHPDDPPRHEALLERRRQRREQHGQGDPPGRPRGGEAQAEIARQAADVQKLYEEKGWVPAPSLDARDDPNHLQMRKLFDGASPAAIRELDPYVEEVVPARRRLHRRRAQARSPARDPAPALRDRPPGRRARRGPAADQGLDGRLIKRMGLMQTHEEMRWSVEMEIEGQHYFQKLFDKLRAEPDDTLLSALVNTEVPEWGRPLTDNELHAEMFADVFVGGSETTTNALAEGIVMLIENPDVWAKLKSDLIAYLEPFCEEVLRLESPVQGSPRDRRRRRAPRRHHPGRLGAQPPLRGGQPRRAAVRVSGGDRPRPQGPPPHLAFGVGSHHCLGAPLARREMYYGFKALVDRVERLWFVEGANDFSHHQNFFLRALKEVHVGFEPVESWTKSGADRAADTRKT